VTEEESAEMGYQAAVHIRAVIDQTMQIPTLSRRHWWGTFLATLAGFCHNDVGPEVHVILRKVTAAALKLFTTKEKRH